MTFRDPLVKDGRSGGLHPKNTQKAPEPLNPESPERPKLPEPLNHSTPNPYTSEPLKP